MTRYFQIVQGKEAPQNKQARELLEYAHRVNGFDKFEARTFSRLLADQKGKETALKGSRADPSQAWNYYRPALHTYGHIKMFEGDTELKPEPLTTDPFNRRKGGQKAATLSDELTKLEERIAADTQRATDLRKLIERANQSASDMSGGSSLWDTKASPAPATSDNAGAAPQADAGPMDAGEIPEAQRRT